MKQQKLSLITVMLMSINIMIGAGVLLAPGIMASVAGNASFIGWIIAALFYIPIVYGVSQLATLMPGEGGIYRYARKVFGEKIGFFCGWLYYLSYILIATTVLSGLRTSLLARYPHIAFFNSPALFLALCLALITSLNMMRISVIGSIQKYLTITKLLPIILAIVLIPFFIKWDFTISIPEIKSLFSPGGLTMAIFGFVGFEFACSLSHEIEGGAKKASLAVMGAFGTVLTIYILFHFGLLHIMGANNLALYTAAGFAPFVGTKFPALSGFLTVLINLATTVCFMSGANGLITLTTEIMQSLA
ncbi:amino acid permease, partial [Candidatus Babeliales bacterium]|nr:amino acid permease [Candidatus Babeliales bacterium]